MLSKLLPSGSSDRSTVSTSAYDSMVSAFQDLATACPVRRSCVQFRLPQPRLSQSEHQDRPTRQPRTIQTTVSERRQKGLATVAHHQRKPSDHHDFLGDPRKQCRTPVSVAKGLTSTLHNHEDDKQSVARSAVEMMAPGLATASMALSHLTSLGGVPAPLEVAAAGIMPPITAFEPALLLLL